MNTVTCYYIVDEDGNDVSITFPSDKIGTNAYGDDGRMYLLDKDCIFLATYDVAEGGYWIDGEFDAHRKPFSEKKS